MKIVGLLSWYEERPSWLAGCVSSMAKLCDHVIAVDGAYAFFPGGLLRPRSSPGQADTIQRVCESTGMGLTLYSQPEPWIGNEIEKRDFTLRLSELVARPNEDWLLVLDADEVLTHVPADIKDRIAATELDVAAVMIRDRDGNRDLMDRMDVEPHCDVMSRRLFRAIPDMHYEQRHYVITGMRDGQRVLLAGPSLSALEPAEQLRDMRLENRTRDRDKDRIRDAAIYYDRVHPGGQLEEVAAS